VVVWAKSTLPFMIIVNIFMQTICTHAVAQETCSSSTIETS
jgi:hypothetical protein